MNYSIIFTEISFYQEISNWFHMFHPAHTDLVEATYKFTEQNWYPVVTKFFYSNAEMNLMNNACVNPGLAILSDT